MRGGLGRAPESRAAGGPGQEEGPAWKPWAQPPWAPGSRHTRPSVPGPQCPGLGLGSWLWDRRPGARCPAEWEHRFLLSSRRGRVVGGTTLPLCPQRKDKSPLLAGWGWRMGAEGALALDAGGVTQEHLVPSLVPGTQSKGHQRTQPPAEASCRGVRLSSGPGWRSRPWGACSCLRVALIPPFVSHPSPPPSLRISVTFASKAGPKPPPWPSQAAPSGSLRDPVQIVPLCPVLPTQTQCAPLSTGLLPCRLAAWPLHWLCPLPGAPSPAAPVA